LPGQPREIITDADGRFRLTGVGRDRMVTLALESPLIQRVNLLQVITRPAKATPFFGGVNPSTFTYVAPGSRPIRGVVRDKSTGMPLAGVKISDQGTNSTTFTNSDGRYELTSCGNVPPYAVSAQPQRGQPYFAVSAFIPYDEGLLDPLTADFELVS